MRREDLELQILDYITNLYSAKYIGLLRVEQSDTTYTFTIGVPSYMARTYINYDSTNDQEFLDFIFEEIRTRNYIRQEYYKVIRRDDSKEE
jgi:hypothetical protein